MNISLSVFGQDINTAIRVHCTGITIISFLFHTLIKRSRSSTGEKESKKDLSYKSVKGDSGIGFDAG